MPAGHRRRRGHGRGARRAPSASTPPRARDAAGPARRTHARLRLGAAQGRPRRRRARCATCSSTAIGFLTENRRYYPQRELAAHVHRLRRPRQHGHERDRVRLRGATIRGRAAKVVIRTDARRRAIDHTESPRPTAQTVVLTLDESHPARRGERARARGGGDGLAWPAVAVVMDPRTGEILALANRPDLQPEPLRRLPELALAQPRRGRRLRAGQHLQDHHRRRRARRRRSSTPTR